MGVAGIYIGTLIFIVIGLIGCFGIGYYSSHRNPSDKDYHDDA